MADVRTSDAGRGGRLPLPAGFNQSISRGAMLLFGIDRLRGRSAGIDVALAALLAVALVAIAYAMDWFLFGTVRFDSPIFFPFVPGALFAARILVLAKRYLCDLKASARDAASNASCDDATSLRSNK